MKILTKKQMINAEQNSVSYGVSLSHLMKNAGFALFTVIKDYAYKNMTNECLLLIGSGNNGGDGLVCANYLKDAGINPTVVLLADAKTDLAKDAFSALRSDIRVIKCIESIPTEEIINAKIIIDCVFGTGFHGEFSNNVKEVFSAVEKSLAYKIACDLPSGVNCENGFAASCTVHYDKTVSFHAAKLGCLLSPAKEYCGEIQVCDIKIPSQAENAFKTELFDISLAKAFLPARPENSHKGTFGRASLLVGSDKYIGAAILSANAALRSGVGIVHVMSTESVVKTIAPTVPEAIFTPLRSASDGAVSEENLEVILHKTEKSSALLIGCGIQKTPDTINLTKEIVSKYKGTIILDADGINCICENIDVLRNTEANVVLTPHPAELSRLVGKDLSNTLNNRISCVLDFCESFGVTVISKSRESFAYNGKKAYLISKGNSALSKGGSGDMLAGICASLIAQGSEPLDAIALASYILGECAETLSVSMSKRGILPRDILNSLPGVIFNIEN